VPQLAARVREAEASLKNALDELRELARGLHPAVLTSDGIGPALDQAASRVPLPVRVTAPDERFAEVVESTVYFVACEALANIAKHAAAHRAEVLVERRNGSLRLTVVDDGVGGASTGEGSGLSGMADRLAALDGRLTLDSPRGGGTTVVAELPLAPAQ
jgi:signal transduction histidine kinase